MLIALLPSLAMMAAATPATLQERALSTPSYMNTNVFSRMVSQSSAVLGDFLYIDCGTYVTKENSTWTIRMYTTSAPSPRVSADQGL